MKLFINNWQNTRRSHENREFQLSIFRSLHHVPLYKNEIRHHYVLLYFWMLQRYIYVILFHVFVWVHNVHYRFRFIFFTSSGSITSHYSGIKPTMIVLERAAEIKPFLSNFSFYKKKKFHVSVKSDMLLAPIRSPHLGMYLAPIRLPHRGMYLAPIRLPH